MGKPISYRASNPHMLIYIKNHPMIHVCKAISVLSCTFTSSLIPYIMHFYYAEFLACDVCVRMNHHAITTIFVILSIYLGRVCIVITWCTLTQI